MSNTIVVAGLGVPGTGLPWAALRNAVREASAGQMYDGSDWWEGLDGLEQPEDGWSARQAFEWIARAKAHLDDQVVRLHKALRGGAPDIAVLRRRDGWLVVAGGFQGFEDVPSFDALLDLSESGIFEMAGVTPFGGWDAPLAGRTLGLDARTTFRFEAADEIWRALDAQGQGRKVDAQVAAVLDDIDHRDQSIRPDGLLINTTPPPELEEVCMRRSESAYLYVFTCAETGPDVEGGAVAAAKVDATAAFERLRPALEDQHNFATTMDITDGQALCIVSDFESWPSDIALLQQRGVLTNCGLFGTHSRLDANADR